MRTQKLSFVLTLVISAGITAVASAGDSPCANGNCNSYGNGYGNGYANGDGYCEGDGEHCAWFADDQQHPGGARQKYKFGKYWPPYARPTGCKEPYMHKYHRAHYWPYPYKCDDRSVIRQVVQQTADNGWMNYTTLYDYHFDAETQELNQAGRLKLQWIVLYSPERYRTVYVAAAANPQDSEIRLANATASTGTICGAGHTPPVMLRVAQSIGTPAEEVYLIRGAYLQSTPAPRLPYGVNSSDPGTGN